MGCRTEKFGAAALLFTFLIETTNGQILKNVPKTVFCVWVIKTNLKYIDIFKILVVSFVWSVFLVINCD